MSDENTHNLILRGPRNKKVGVKLSISTFDLYEKGILKKPLINTQPNEIEEVKKTHIRYMGSINNNFINTKIKTWDELEELFLSKSFCRGTFDSNYSRITKTYKIKSRTIENFSEQNLIVFDIDSGIEPDYYLDILTHKLNIKPNLIYSSLRDSDNLRKYRIVYVLPETVKNEDKERLTYLNKRLNRKLGGDQNAEDLARLYLPGKKIIYRHHSIDFKTNSKMFEWFDMLLESNLDLGTDIDDDIDTDNKSKYKKVTYKKTIWIEDLTFVIDNNMDNITHLKPNLNKINYNLYSYKNFQKQKYNFNTQRFKILSEFLTKDYRFSWGILRGLALNLKFIKGGRKIFFDRMRKTNMKGRCPRFDEQGLRKNILEKYEPHHFSTMEIIFKSDLLPQSLENFSPFKEDHRYKNLLTDKLGWGSFIQTEEIEKISLKEAEKGFLKSFNSIIKNKPVNTKEDETFLQKNNIDPNLYEDNIGQITIFKLPTGLGKTQALINLKGVIIAAPTNKLKNEIYDDRMVSKSVKTPDPIYFSDPDLRDEYDLLINSGMETSPIVNTIINSGAYKNYNIKKSDILKCEQYKEDNKNSRETEDEENIITTHTRLIFHNFDKDGSTTIFDEDPLKELTKEGNILLSDFEKFEKSPIKSYMNKMKKYFTNCKEDEIIDKKDYKPTKEVIDFLLKRSHPDFIRLFKKSIRFSIRRITKPGKDEGKRVINFYEDYTHLLEKRNTIILSATVNPDVYKSLYGEHKVKVYEWDNVKLKGSIIQDTRRSYSMNRLSKLIESNDIRLREIIKSSIRFKKTIRLDKRDIFGGEKQYGMPIITHQKKRRWLREEGVSEDHIKLYFGNTTGFDSYRGRDMIVLGTPHRPPNIYLKFLIDGNRKIDLSMDENGKEVEWKGFKWRMKTYNDPTLSMLQLSDIESELIQAIGRGRSLREKSTVYLYSNFPLKITTHFK